MATINLGRIKPVWKGTYAGGTAYVVDDLVSYTDTGITSAYICVTASTGNNPSTGGTAHASWNYLAKGVAAAVNNPAWQSVVTGHTTMVSDRGYFVNTTGGAITMTLPTSPSIGDFVSIVDYAGTFDTNICTIGRASQKIMGASADMTVSTERAAFTLVFTDATHGWLLTEK